MRETTQQKPPHLLTGMVNLPPSPRSEGRIRVWEWLIESQTFRPFLKE